MLTITAIDDVINVGLQTIVRQLTGDRWLAIIQVCIACLVKQGIYIYYTTSYLNNNPAPLNTHRTLTLGSTEANIVFSGAGQVQSGQRT